MIVFAPAKINMFLEVTGRRKDGYHNIESLMRAVSLYDKLIIKQKPRDVTLKCNIKNLPVDETNLVIKAAILLKNELNIKNGAEIYLEKNIPMGAGLGGGSSERGGGSKGAAQAMEKGNADKKAAGACQAARG